MNKEFLNIEIGDMILANGEKFLVTAKPYIPDDIETDSAIDSDYIDGEYVIPVDSGGAIYESEIIEIIKRKK